MRELYQKSCTMRNSGNINRPFVRFAIPDPRDPVARAFLIASDILEFLKHEAEQTLSLNPEDEMDISAAAEAKRAVDSALNSKAENLIYDVIQELEANDQDLAASDDWADKDFNPPLFDFKLRLTTNH